MTHKRRDFLKSVSLSAGALGAGFFPACSPQDEETAVPGEESGARFKISLAQWSLHKMLRAGELDPMEFAKFTQENFGINAVEYVNQFYGVQDEKLGLQPPSQDVQDELKKRGDDLGVEHVLIMCDRVGNLGDPDDEARTNAIQGHHGWATMARYLGCHSIRVNARSDDSLPAEEQLNLCVDGLSRLAEFTAQFDLNVIVENHGGLSSDGSWLADVMEAAGRDNCGTLPDFGNFYLVKKRGNPEQYAQQKANFTDGAYQEDETGLYYDRYEGIRDLMPYAEGVSAKAHDFDENGNEIHTDFFKAMEIVAKSDYSGYVGIEYEGDELSEVEGVKATQDLLRRAIAKV